MKFVAIAALLATTTAVKISSLNAAQSAATATKGGPPMWEEVLEALDEDDSGTISWDEVMGFLKKVAKEHDYKLTKADLEEVHEVFKMVDTDDSGDIDKAEFEAAMKAHGGLGQTRKMFAQIKKGGPPTWDEVLDELDADESGTVSWDEVMAFLKEIAKEHDYKLTKEDLEKVHEVFKMVDTDKSGDIDKAEFEAAIKAHGGLGQKTRKMFAQVRKGGPPTWEEVLEELDEDESGTVSWPEVMGFLKKIAKEHDYKLTKEDLEKVHEVFKMIDTDGSGDIDKAEFEAALKAHGGLGQKTRRMFAQVSKGGPPTWDEVLEELDEDESGTVSWDEVMAFLKKIAKEHDYKLTKEDLEKVHEVFKMVDTDKSGDIDKAEFEAAIKAHGGLNQKTRKMFAQVTKGGPPTWDEVLEELDEDGSGTVSWPELLNFLKKIAKEHDYKLTKDDIEQVHEMFKMVDTDESGDVDKAEFEAAVAAHGGLNQKARKMYAQIKKGGPPSWEDVLEVLDEDGSGTVSWEEIVGFIKKVEEEHGVKISKEDKKAIKAAFEQVDADGSGDIDKKEFEAAVAAMEGLAALRKYM